MSEICEQNTQNTSGDSFDTIFASFHENKSLDELEGACNYFYVTTAEYGVSIAKIYKTDADIARPFSRALCHCKFYCKDHNQEKSPEGFGLCTIFEYGFDVLESFLESAECIPEREGSKLALAKLLTFLQDENGLKAAESALLKSTSVSDEDWTLLVTHHLMSKLAVCSEYQLDDTLRGKVKNGLCPCGCGEAVQGRYDDTSIGLPTAWHGHIDVIMEATAVTTLRDIRPQDLPENEMCVEVERAKDLRVASKYEIRAQTIVFAFWQQKKHPKLRKLPVPTIAVSREHIALFFYDSVKDYLLESPCLDLFKGNNFTGRILNLSTVIALWLSLNYKYFCSGVSDDIEATNFTADFFKEPLINAYRDKIKAPCEGADVKQWFFLQKISTRQTKKGNEDVNRIHRNQNKRQRIQ